MTGPTVAVCAACGADRNLVPKVTLWPHDEEPVERLVCREAGACNTRAGLLRSGRLRAERLRAKTGTTR